MKDRDKKYYHILGGRLLVYNIQVLDEVRNTLSEIEYKDKDTLGCVVMNLLACVKKGNKLVYSRDTAERKIPNRNNTSVYKVKRCVDYLIGCGWVYNVVGVASVNKGKRVPSVLLPTEEFINYWKDVKMENKAEKQYNKDCDVIILRGKDKLSIPFEKTDNIKKMETLVRKVNDMNSHFDAIMPDGTILLNAYCRIFNENFNLGGRWYRADVLGIPSDERLQMRINGENVIECDFSNYHFRIAAALHGIDLRLVQDDLYAGFLANPDHELNRFFVKMAVNIMFNTPSRKNAIAALQKIIDEHLEDGDYPNGTLKRASDIVYGVIEHYPEFVDIFFSDPNQGMKMQRLDSEIVAGVLEKFLECNVACFPIHDSFIVSETYVDLLMETMADVFRQVTGSDCVVPITMEWESGGEHCKVQVVK